MSDGNEVESEVGDGDGDGDGNNSGGGLFIGGNLNGQTCYLLGSILKNNSAKRGGGFANESTADGKLWVENCLIINNNSQSWGTAGFIFGETTISNCTIVVNESDVYSEGILSFHNSNTNATLINSCVYSNSGTPLVLDLYEPVSNTINILYSNIPPTIILWLNGRPVKILILFGAITCMVSPRDISSLMDTCFPM